MDESSERDEDLLIKAVEEAVQETLQTIDSEERRKYKVQVEGVHGTTVYLCTREESEHVRLAVAGTLKRLREEKEAAQKRQEKRQAKLAKLSAAMEQALEKTKKGGSTE